MFSLRSVFMMSAMVVIMTACANDPTAPTRRSVVGVYDLVSVNESPLPGVRASYGTSLKYMVDSATLTLHSDSVAIERSHGYMQSSVQIDIGYVMHNGFYTQPASDSQTGRWHIVKDTLYRSVNNGSEYGYLIKGDTLKLLRSPILRLVYVKRH